MTEWKNKTCGTCQFAMMYPAGTRSPDRVCKRFPPNHKGYWSVTSTGNIACAEHVESKQTTMPLDWSAYELAEWADEYAEKQMPLDKHSWGIYAIALRVQENFEREYPSDLNDLDYMTKLGLCRKLKVPDYDDGNHYPEMCEAGDYYWEFTHLGHAFCDAAHSIVYEKALKETQKC